MPSQANRRYPGRKPPVAIDTGENSDNNKIDLRNEIQQDYRSNPLPWSEWVFQHLHLARNKRVLELGSGTGAFWQENAARLKAGTAGSWKMILSDRSLSMVQKAQTNLSCAHQRTRFLNLDGQALPFSKESVDAVLAVGVLDLVPHLSQALHETWRVLRPCGQLIATAGGKGHLQELEDMLRPFLPPGMADKLGGNEKHFGLENGKEVLAQYFEEIVRHDYSDRLVFTRMEPVLEYVLSEQAIAWSIPLDKLGEFVHRIKRSLEQSGRIKVTIRKGLFIARKKEIGD